VTKGEGEEAFEGGGSGHARDPVSYAGKGRWPVCGLEGVRSYFCPASH
jgi:hypothetical protein